MFQPGLHAMMPATQHDEDARMSFVYQLKEHVATKIGPGNKLVYETSVEPAFRKRHGRSPKDRHEVHREMRGQDYWRMFGSLSRLYQELKQSYGGDIVDRQIGDLNQRARGYREQAKKGSLRLDPNLEIPRYQSGVDIHCLPGGYHTERSPDDVTAGAMYDPGVYYFAMGAMGPYNEDMGVSIVGWLKKTRPQFKPRRILDMGCTVGHCTTPYVDGFPGAEVHAIDLAAPVLRYAHARAEAMGKAVHFAQQNAERTDYEDESFDLIVSHILLHETSYRAVYNIMKECQRLLKPGGLVVHAEAPVRNAEIPAFDAFMHDWATHYNAEPFWGTLHDMDLKKPALQAGFAEKDVFVAYTPKLYGGGPGLTGGGQWLLYGANK
ncbi:MAG: class I SAM-dependent methyltransferase [Alphaproteobacteria bacterium]|nr:class I SAM-dependent methyltransferase [Alphaproteobacteria bacterium]